jgi:16S rRNA (cytosine967-C5)-methyltransferase
MRVTSHAAVNETVAQVKAAKFESAAGYVNAVLRRASERPRDEWIEMLTAQAKDGVEALSLTTSHPAWIVRALSAALIADNRPDELPELLEADNSPTPVGLIDLDLARTREADEREPARFSPRGFHLVGRGSLARVTEGSAGLVRVQDEGSQLAALALINAAPIATNERWLDMCAAPGGKAAVLAAYAPATGTVVANESNRSRMSLLSSSLEPWPRVELTNRDAREIAQEAPQYTRILLDAPCSGLGALRRRPESRWRKTPRDIAELTALQHQLLNAACDALVDGGLVAYVTCSPHIAETRAIVNQVLKKRDDMTELAVSPILNSFTREPVPTTGSELSVQLWPHAHQTDAMFIALLLKSTK